MALSDQSRISIAFYLVIVLTVCQVITFAALLVLYKVFCDLKKNVERYKDSLPLVTINTPAAYVRNSPARQRCSIGTKQKAELDENITRVPTPDPDRRSSYMKEAVPLPTTVAIKTKTESAAEIPRGLSFSSFNALLRGDSGIGSASMTHHSSLSSSASDSLRPREVNRRSRDVSRDSHPDPVPFHKEDRAASNASRCSSRGSSRDHHNTTDVQTKTPQQELQDEEHFLPRLSTMPIEMIGVTQGAGNEKRYKRASKILNQLSEEERSTTQDSFVNSGFNGDGNTSDVLQRAPLASEESSYGLNSEIDGRIEDEVYENQEVIEQTRWSIHM